MKPAQRAQSDEMAGLPVVYSGEVKPEWVDYNNHMGDFAYGIVFSNSGDNFLELADLTPEYRTRTNCTIYTLETHTKFLREVDFGNALTVTAQLLDCDEKRVHLYLKMYDRDEALVAEQEQLIMHMKRPPGGTPAPTPFPPGMMEKINAIWAEHRLLPPPAGAGARMGIRRKPQKVDT
jgi:acyl-CoA thioester hydrolase